MSARRVEPIRQHRAMSPHSGAFRRSASEVQKIHANLRGAHTNEPVVQAITAEEVVEASSTPWSNTRAAAIEARSETKAAKANRRVSCSTKAIGSSERGEATYRSRTRHACCTLKAAFTTNPGKRATTLGEDEHEVPPQVPH